jgi:hypothetical protein
MGLVLYSKLLHIWTIRALRTCSLTFFTTSNFASVTIFLELNTNAYLLIRRILNESELNMELGPTDSYQSEIILMKFFRTNTDHVRKFVYVI